MKIRLFNFEIDDIKCTDRTLSLSILEFDWSSWNACVFEVGIYQGNFRFEILFHRFFTWRIIDYFDEKYGNDPTTVIIRSLCNFLRKCV